MGNKPEHVSVILQRVLAELERKASDAEKRSQRREVEQGATHARGEL